MWTSNSTLGVHIINPWPQDLPYTKLFFYWNVKKNKKYIWQKYELFFKCWIEFLKIN
jgi:hypothetical protein